MKLGKYLVLVGLSLIVACGNPPTTVTLTSSELNPAFGSSVTFTATATPAGKVVKLELLEGTTIQKTVENAANLEQNVLMDVAGKRSFTARVTDSAGVVASSAVVEVETKIPPAPVVMLSATPNPVVIGSSSKLTASVVSGRGVSKVEFFDGVTLLGSDSSTPFTIVVDDFSLAGSRDFRAVATDNNGLKGEGLVTVTVVDRIPTSFEFESDDFVCAEGFQSCSLLSPDVVKITAKYELNTISKQTNWVILKDDLETPAPTDGSFGTITAIAGDPDGLLSSRVQYTPPSVTDFSQQLTIFIQAISVQDSIQRKIIRLSVSKKGTIERIELGAFQNSTINVGVTTEIRFSRVGIIGNTYNFVQIKLSDLNNIGKLECLQNTPCRLTPTSISGFRFKFTGLQPGNVTLLATSLDVKPDGSHPTDTLKLTVNP